LKKKRRQNQNLQWNLGLFLVFFKSPWWVKFNKFYFINFKYKVWKILFLGGFCYWKIPQNAKIKKQSIKFSMCSRLGQQHKLHLYSFIYNNLKPLSYLTSNFF
jgi:hypothetical protein